jgi:peptide/nickel transport system substrate-binding protein
VIHVPDADERSLGPLGLWGPLVFLHLAVSDEYSDDPEPRLLDRWEHTPDYTEWTVHVREGVLWGDGVPVTAEDIKFSLELWAHPEVGYEYRWFDTITVLDSHTLRITFPDPPGAKVWVYNWLGMHPRHLLGSLDLDELFSWPFWIEPVGDGPFRYVSHIPSIMTELEANPDYYGEPPDIERVVLRYGGNGVTELLSGNVDVATRVTPLEAMQLARDPRFRIYYRDERMQIAIAWNHRNPLFQDADVRRALTMSIDRRELHRLLNYPDDLPIFDVPVLTRHHHEGLVPDPLPFDPERAARLLAGAGWVDSDGDGILDRDGQDFGFTLLTSGPTSAQAVYIQDQFRRLGVRMEVGTYDRNALRQRTREHNFDAAIQRYNYIEWFGRFPITGYQNAEVTRLRDIAWTTLDQNEADVPLRELWQIIEAEIPITYLHPEISYLAAHRRVGGIPNDRGRLPDTPRFPAFVENLRIDDEGR